MRFILLTDFPICSASSVCLTDGFFYIKFNTASSSKVQSKVSIWHFGTLAFRFWHFEKRFYAQNQRALCGSLTRDLCREEGLRKTVPKTLWWNEYLFANRYSLHEPMHYGNTKSFHGTHRY